MSDIRVNRLAKLLVGYCCEIDDGDRVAIYGSPEAEGLMREVYRHVLRAGGFPYSFMGYEVYQSYGGFDDIFFKEASEAQLRHIFETESLAKTEFEAMISIRAKRNTRLLSGVEPYRQRIRNAAYAGVNEIYRQRSAERELKWVITLYPTHAQAQDADMSRDEFAEFTFAACYVDHEDPIAIWQGIRERQQRLVDWLAGKKRVVVEGPHVDLTLSIEGRTFVNSDGKRNMPSGEIFTGPVEDSVEGWVRFTYPAVKYGVLVEGAELQFEGGRIIEAKATENEAFLLEMLETDEGARRLGEFAIGTNDQINRFTKNILFDEKIGGTIHMAVGFGYPETGSRNESSIHWDMITDMRDGGRITVDGEPFYESGQFLI